jgi:transcriptional regulator with XRE-family HTH domain
MAQGSRKRPVPKLLAKKIKLVRTVNGWTQQEMAERVGEMMKLRSSASPPDGAMVSRFERGEREPNLIVLYSYAKVVGVTVDVFIDDRFTLDNFTRALT